MTHGIPSFTDDEILNGVFYIHNQRHPKAKQVDNHMSSRVTPNVFQWLDDPNRYDFMGIDTIKREKPHNYSRSRGAKAAKKLRRVQLGF